MLLKQKRYSVKYMTLLSEEERQILIEGEDAGLDWVKPATSALISRSVNLLQQKARDKARDEAIKEITDMYHKDGHYIGPPAKEKSQK